jgi:hypothetical protein
MHSYQIYNAWMGVTHMAFQWCPDVPLLLRGAITKERGKIHSLSSIEEKQDTIYFRLLVISS